jgi:hypothetical protein
VHIGWLCSKLYRTIPIAKRRYYGRVQQGVHDFLAMGPELVKANTSGENVQFFFDAKGVVVVEARRQDSKFADRSSFSYILSYSSERFA